MKTKLVSWVLLCTGFLLFSCATKHWSCAFFHVPYFHSALHQIVTTMLFKWLLGRMSFIFFPLLGSLLRTLFAFPLLPNIDQMVLMSHHCRSFIFYSVFCFVLPSKLTSLWLFLAPYFISSPFCISKCVTHTHPSRKLHLLPKSFRIERRRATIFRWLCLH